MAKLHKGNPDGLIAAVATLRGESEVRQFLEDLFTEREMTELSRRWQAAQMLNRKISYTVISNKTGLSSTTVARVSKSLKNGTGGYRLLLDRVQNSDSVGSNREISVPLEKVEN